MNLKKYLEKQTIKSLLIDFILVTTLTSGLFFSLYYFFLGKLPSFEWFPLILVYSIVESFNRNRENEQKNLIKSNYWKLKRELDKKSGRKRRN